jgi:hypothetical protein
MPTRLGHTCSAGSGQAAPESVGDFVQDSGEQDASPGSARGRVTTAADQLEHEPQQTTTVLRERRCDAVRCQADRY